MINYDVKVKMGNRQQLLHTHETKPFILIISALFQILCAVAQSQNNENHFCLIISRPHSSSP